MSVVVIEIGCLECSNPSELLGVYATVEQARETYPHAKLRSEMRTLDWHGEGMDVIFPLPAVEPTRAPAEHDHLPEQP